MAKWLIGELQPQYVTDGTRTNLVYHRSNSPLVKAHQVLVCHHQLLHLFCH